MRALPVFSIVSRLALVVWIVWGLGGFYSFGEEAPAGPVDDNVLKEQTEANAHIVMICEYSKGWIAPDKSFPKGQLVYRATVVNIYKGRKLKVGDKIEFRLSIEEPPRWLDSFEAVAEGRLRYIFLNDDDLENVSGKSYKITGYWHFGFYFDDPEFSKPMAKWIQGLK